jgi:hypothetical protein
MILVYFLAEKPEHTRVNRMLIVALSYFFLAFLRKLVVFLSRCSCVPQTGIIPHQSYLLFSQV